MDKPICSSSSSPCYGAQEPYIVDRTDESKCFGMKVDIETAKEKKLAYIVSQRQTQGHCERKKLWFFLLFTTIEVTKLKITLM